MEFRSKLMQKAVSELLLESHVTSVARSINSVTHARRISAFWLQKAVDHEGGNGQNNALIVDFLTSVPKIRRESMDADDLLGDIENMRSGGIGRFSSDLKSMDEIDEDGDDDGAGKFGMLKPRTSSSIPRPVTR